MKYTNESNFEYRNGEMGGPKYLMRGPNIDWGVMLIRPGDKMGAHGHNETEETFYFLSGEGNIIINDKSYTAKIGDVFYIEPKEKHDIQNTGSKDMKIVFIKSPYLPDDKVKY